MIIAMEKPFFPLEIWYKIISHLSKNEAGKLLTIDYLAHPLKLILYKSIEVGTLSDGLQFPWFGDVPTESLTLSSNQLIDILRSPDRYYIDEIHLNCTPISVVRVISDILNELKIRENITIKIFANYSSTYDGEAISHLLELTQLLVHPNVSWELEGEISPLLAKADIIPSLNLIQNKYISLRALYLLSEVDVMVSLAEYEFPCLKILEMLLPDYPPDHDKASKELYPGFKIMSRAPELEILRLYDNIQSYESTTNATNCFPEFTVFTISLSISSPWHENLNSRSLKHIFQSLYAILGWAKLEQIE